MPANPKNKSTNELLKNMEQHVKNKNPNVAASLDSKKQIDDTDIFSIIFVLSECVFDEKKEFTLTTDEIKALEVDVEFTLTTERKHNFYFKRNGIKQEFSLADFLKMGDEVQVSTEAVYFPKIKGVEFTARQATLQEAHNAADLVFLNLLYALEYNHFAFPSLSKLLRQHRFHHQCQCINKLQMVNIHKYLLMNFSDDDTIQKLFLARLCRSDTHE
ncbi:hypothetical protein FQA39_LY19140 [Lamprigera yunnana]|nr:hypothetical protein FQA39_LY19140 [Lamprigera yunnana]